MSKALIIFGFSCSGKTTYALEQMKTGEWDGIVSEDMVCNKIMNIMKQQNYHDTEGASQVKIRYWSQVNYDYLREQLLALEILKFGYGKNLIFEGYGLNSLEDRKVLYNILKILGFTEVQLVSMPDKKGCSDAEFVNHEIVSYQVTKYDPAPPPRHPESFYEAWAKATKRLHDL